MICHACGATVPENAESCPLCGRTIDRSELYAGFIRKGDQLLEAGDYDRAAASYKKAMEAGAAGPDIYLKLGAVYERKKDKMAAGMYLKAIELDFGNDRAHNLLIGLYLKYGRLNDIKAWYQKNLAAGADPAITGKYLKIIENMSRYQSNPEFVIREKESNVAGEIFKSMKSYAIMNVVIGIIAVMFSVGYVGVYIYKVNMSSVFIFGSIFFISTMAVVMFYRMKDAKKKREKKKGIEDLVKGMDLTKKDG